MTRSPYADTRANSTAWHSQLSTTLLALWMLSLAACGGSGSNSDSTTNPTAPTITTQPQGQTVTVGAMATFTVVAAGTVPLSYQWFKNSVAIGGATSSTYTTPGTVPGDNGASFTVQVSNSAGTQTSNSATLTVTAAPPVAPTITTQPLSQSVMVGAMATFTVVATGTAPLSYQWSKNTVAIAGATNSTYTTPATVSGDSGSTFTVNISNVVGSQTSNPATLTVTGVGPTITTQPQNQSVTVGAMATFTVVAAGTAPLSYQWSKNTVAIAGATNSTYTTPATVSGDNGSSFTVNVSNNVGSQTSNAATLTVTPAPMAPTITAQPLSQTVTVGATAMFSVAATGTTPLTYQWYKSSAVIAGATSSSYMTPPTVSGDNGSSFTVIVSNAAGSQTSNAATLNVNVPPTITTQPQSQSVAVGAMATFSVTATGTPPFSYQWYKNGTAISGAVGQSYTTPATMSSDNGSSFTVKVSNVAGSQTSGAAILTVTAAGAATPVLFQHISSSTDPEGNGIPGHTFVFRTEALPPNTVAVMGVSAPGSITVTISDTLVGSWSGALCTASGGAGNANASVFVQALGATGGTDSITINVGSASTQPVQFDITFWQNINPSSPANGSLCSGNITPTAGGVIAPGSFTPATNNDSNGGNVIWNYTPICTLYASSNPSSWTPASSFTLLNGDIIWTTNNGFPEASQYYVQTTSASVAPSITATGDTTDCFNSTSVALAVANNGATAPSTIHVAKIIHESYIGFSSPGTQTVMFPTTGNLRVATFTWFDGCPGGNPGCLTSSSLSSSDGCVWTEKLDNGGAAIFYAQNCAPCANCTLSLLYSGSRALPPASFRLYDVQNASASSFQNSAGNNALCGTTVTDAPTITPSGASSGLTIAVNGNGQGPITAVTSPPGAVFDLWTFAGQTDSDIADNADASSHLYFSSNATQNWNYTKAVGSDECYWEAAVFN